MNKNTCAAFTILFLLFLSACGQLSPEATSSLTQVKAWFDSPQPGSYYLPPNPCMFVMHGASPNGISLFELSIIGQETRQIPATNPSETLSLLSIDCGITTPGDYEISLRVQDGEGNWSNMATTNLRISNGAQEEGGGFSIIPSPPPEQAPTTSTMLLPTIAPFSLLIPTYSPSANATPYANVSVEEVSTDTVFIGSDQCGPQTFSVIARGVDSNGIYELIFFYRIISTSTSEWNGLHMDPIGNDQFRSTLNLKNVFGQSAPFNQGKLEYYVTILNNNSEYSAQTEVMSDVIIKACPAATSPCSSFTDPRTCAAQGCVWKTLPGMGPPISVCEAP